MNSNGLRRTISRRHFLRVSAMGAMAGALAACQPSVAPVPEAQPPAAPVQTAKEAPALVEMVAAGTLPPLEERLPNNPLVIEPIEQIGRYGGTWRTALLGGDDTSWLQRTIGYEALVRWKPDFTGVIPNIAESFEVLADGTEFVFRLREGMNWSDGHPFTADDILFWYEDVLLDDELRPVKPAWLLTDGELPVVEKQDDYTVVFRFVVANGLFLQNIATGRGEEITQNPRHYLEQFHPKYNPDGIDQLVSESGLDSWFSLFESKADTWANAEKPVLHGWTLRQGLGEATAQLTAERNPYYWKVDTEGNQLPYLDTVVFDLTADAEVLVLKALNGEIDMMDRHIGTPQNKALFVDNMEQGDYHLFETVPTDAASMVINLNLTHKDPVKREIYQNKDFRIGLSHAINRQEIIDLVYVGQGEPYQAAPRPDTQFYHERLAKQYTEYDPDLANQHLDQAGYTERDAEGFRLGPDGQRITINMDTTAAYGLSWLDVLELVQRQWRDVGIDMQINNIDRSLLFTRLQGNEHDANTWDGAASFQDALLDARYYLPQFVNGSKYAPLWAYWYEGSAPGEEPPEEVKQQMALYDQLLITSDEDEQVEIMNQILEMAADQFYVMNISLRPNGYGVVKNQFHNVPASMPWGWLYPTPAPTNPCQYFIGE